MLIDWLWLLIPAAVTMFVIPLSVRWLERSRLHPRPAAEARELVLPHSVRVMGLGYIVAAATLGYVIDNALSREQTSWHYLVPALVFVFGLGVTFEFHRVRHEVNDDGMQFTPLLGQRGTFAWNDVKHVTRNKHIGWYRITLCSGATVRVSGMLMGLPEFARTLLQQVPLQRIAPDTRVVLEDTAQGRLPPLR